MLQNTLLQEIIKQLPSNTSLNDAIATALEISYDAAHRRTSLKSKFSLEEGIQLAQRFNISLDSLYGLTHQQFVSVEKTITISNEKELQQYFENSYNSLTPLVNRKDCEVLYSAKDIPIFYTLNDNKLSRFKIYVWMKLLDKKLRNVSFENYHPDLTTIQTAKKLGDLYKNLQITEIWDTTTINSTLKQIHFYYKAGQTSLKTTLELCSLLKELLNEISLKVVSKKYPFKLYHNELLLNTNNVLVSTPKQQSLYVPFSMLSYYLTHDKRVFEEAKTEFNNQLRHSKLLNTSGEKEQNTFYRKMMQKIDALQELIKAEQALDFE